LAGIGQTGARLAALAWRRLEKEEVIAALMWQRKAGKRGSADASVSAESTLGDRRHHDIGTARILVTEVLSPNSD
jgi:hypothetical protein